MIDPVHRLVKRTLRTLFLAFLPAVALGAGTAAPADGRISSKMDAPREISIPGGTLANALDKLGDQSGIQIMYEGSLAEGRRVAGISGTYTVRAALAQLLVDTGLIVDTANDRTVVLRKAGAPTSGVAPADQMRLAQASAAQEQQAAADAGDAGAERNQVVVRDSKGKPAPFSTANLDLTRTEDDALPFQVFEARDIELSGAASLQEFLQNRLPQNFEPGIPSELDGAGNGSVERMSRVDMRGWGAAETVILLNGRRLAPQYQINTGDSLHATPNLQAIALGSIERIEILTSAGSAIYGESATGGVINIITRQDFRGGQLSVSYETPSDVHTPRRRVDLNYGMPLRWNMGLRMSAGYSDSEPLLARDRSQMSIERWRRLALERQPSRLFHYAAGSTTVTDYAPIFGATPNIRTADTRLNATDPTLNPNLFGPGTANFTTIPDGYAGEGLAAFRPGVYNTGLADGVAGNSLVAANSPLGTVTRDVVFSIGVDKRMGEHWRWSLDYRHATNDSEGVTNASRLFAGTREGDINPVVPAAAPGNPFGQAVAVALVDPRLQRPELKQHPATASDEVNLTLRGGVGAWRGFLDFSYSSNRSSIDTEVFEEPHGGWNSAFLSGAYNPFVDLRRQAPADPGFYENYVASRQHYDSAVRLHQSTLKLSGPVLRLPAGVAQVTAGVEWQRSDRNRSSGTFRYEDGVSGEPMALSNGSDEDSRQVRLDQQFIFNTYAGYAEVTVPVLAAAQGVPLARTLEFFGSGRLSHIRRDGLSSAGVPFEFINKPHLYAAGVRYEPLEGVTLRLSQSIGFKPPNHSQVMPGNPPVRDMTGLRDPVRDEPLTLTPSMYIQGGNPEVKAETTDSINLGLILQPRAWRGFRASVDYLDSTRNDAISTISARDMLNLEADFPGRIQRGVPDGTASGVGRITFVDLRQINLRQIRSRSVDLSLEQRFENAFGGRVSLAAVASKNLSFKVQTSNSAPAVEQVRNRTASLFSRQIKWNANGQLRWENQRWDLGWAVRYFDYIYVRTGDLLLQGSDRAPWKLNHDLNVSYRAAVLQNPQGINRWLSGTAITFGVKNVFDEGARFWAPTFDAGIAPYDSIMGRSVWMQMRRDFQ